VTLNISLFGVICQSSLHLCHQ